MVEVFFLYRPSPVKLSPRYFAARDNFKGVTGTTFALPSSHQNGHPPYSTLSPPFAVRDIVPHFSPQGAQFQGGGSVVFFFLSIQRSLLRHN